MLWLSGRSGSGAARPEAPNFEGADPRAPVNPGGLAGRRQEPVSPNDTLLSSPAAGSFSSDAAGLGRECTEGSNGGENKPKRTLRSQGFHFQAIFKRERTIATREEVFCGPFKMNKSGK